MYTRHLGNHQDLDHDPDLILLRCQLFEYPGWAPTHRESICSGHPTRNWKGQVTELILSFVRKLIIRSEILIWTFNMEAKGGKGIEFTVHKLWS